MLVKDDFDNKNTIFSRQALLMAMYYGMKSTFLWLLCLPIMKVIYPMTICFTVIQWKFFQKDFKFLYLPAIVHFKGDKCWLNGCWNCFLIVVVLKFNFSFLLFYKFLIFSFYENTIKNHSFNHCSSCHSKSTRTSSFVSIIENFFCILLPTKWHLLGLNSCQAIGIFY